MVSVWYEQAAGLGGVWARENTPEAIWDVRWRKEVYATTGDRPFVRVFAGWDFVPADRDRPDFAANGYAHGVSMGGNLSKASADKRPAFVVYALRDPDGPNLKVSKLSKDGSARMVRRGSASSTSRSQTVAKSAPMAAARLPSEAPSTRRMRRTAIPSGPLCCRYTGKT